MFLALKTTAYTTHDKRTQSGPSGIKLPTQIYFLSRRMLFPRSYTDNPIKCELYLKTRKYVMELVSNYTKFTLNQAQIFVLVFGLLSQRRK